jgi:comEA protein
MIIQSSTPTELPIAVFTSTVTFALTPTLIPSYTPLAVVPPQLPPSPFDVLSQWLDEFKMELFKAGSWAEAVIGLLFSFILVLIWKLLTHEFPDLARRTESWWDSLTYPGKIININTADQTVLESISGIGPSLANNIIQYRNTNGNFKTIDDLLMVPGIGRTKLDKIRRMIKV